MSSSSSSVSGSGTAAFARLAGGFLAAATGATSSSVSGSATGALAFFAAAAAEGAFFLGLASYSSSSSSETLARCVRFSEERRRGSQHEGGKELGSEGRTEESSGDGPSCPCPGSWPSGP